MVRRTAAQQKGAEMRARGRDYRGGYTRSEISSGEPNKQTCKVRGCRRRQIGPYCYVHREGD